MHCRIHKTITTSPKHCALMVITHTVKLHVLFSTTNQDNIIIGIELIASITRVLTIQYIFYANDILLFRTVWNIIIPLLITLLTITCMCMKPISGCVLIFFFPTLFLHCLVPLPPLPGPSPSSPPSSPPHLLHVHCM